MKTILVDDEPIMLRSFVRLSAGIDSIEIVGKFEYVEEALDYAHNNKVDLAVLDVKMPVMSGIELAVKLREIHPDILIVFISAYDEYVRDSNVIGGDYYIVKPYTREMIEMMVDKMELLAGRLKKNVYIQMFGRFNVKKDGVPLKMSGKTKEILALVASRCGKEISNEEIYSTIWEGREYSNKNMKVYYNALKRLREILAENGLSNLLLSTPRGQMLNTEMCDCDYYEWKEHKNRKEGKDGFEGEFLSEYSWGEYILGGILNDMY